MPLPFALVCDLLEEAHSLCSERKPNTKAVAAWFARHRNRINASDCNLAALLSTLLPERRTDRVYCIQANGLERIIGRALMLGSSRLKELATYKQPGLGLDLADCVERLLKVTPNPIQPEKLQVTVEEIDETLHGVASNVRWSSPSIRSALATNKSHGRSDLELFYRRFTPREAKWFTRLILKDYQPLIFNSHLIFQSCDPILPFILKIQDDFTVAIKTLQQARVKLQSMCPRTSHTDRKILSTIQPQLSVKIGRLQWFKARSIKHCLDMSHGQMSVESKIDGEFCQVHVDANKGRQGIQIYSKSGKDSTEDRHRLHGIIMESLRIGKADARVKRDCILEGELVIYSDLEKKILPFHHIRKQVARRGRLMNVDQDSPPRSYEHLMIVYYDILLLDGRSLLNLRHSERFKLLEQTIECSQGQAELVPRQIIDTNHPLAASALRKAFAKIIVDKKEGLVLKPDEPYFNFDNAQKPFSSTCIKFKKDYVGHFGDVGDFAVVGAGFNPTKARSYDIEDLKWTHFYLGCLDNREEVKRWNATPEFTIVNVVELNETMLKTFVSYANPMPVPIQDNADTKLSISPGVQTTTPMTVAFTNPPVFDLRCFSFDKAGNTGFWSLRFPSVSKVHFDRDFSDTVSFERLQEMATEATTAPELEDSQENLQWIAKLEQADPRGVAVDAATQLTTTTMPTPSPRRQSQNSASFTSLDQSLIYKARDVTASQSQGFVVPPQPSSFRSPALATPYTQMKCVDFSSGKRGSPSNATSSSRKRRKSSVSKSTCPPSPSRRAESQTRRPLEDIDGNSSQKTTTSHLSFTDNSNWPSQKPMNQSANNGKGVGSLSAMEKSSQENISFSQYSQILDKSVIVISDSESDTQSTLPSSPPSNVEGEQNVKTLETVLAAHSRGRHTSCQYAASNCQLANRQILLPLHMSSHSTEIASLFQSHGLMNILKNAEEWFESNQHYTLTSQEAASKPSKMMFVDTVDKATETEKLLAWIEKVRKDLPDERREWISVYDWRVLKHLTIFEDESITKKYYDGFLDPWRRWYCGLV